MDTFPYFIKKFCFPEEFENIDDVGVQIFSKMVAGELDCTS